MSKRRVNAQQLESIGVPSELVAEALKAESRGLFDYEAPEDLVQRTIEECSSLFLAPPASPSPQQLPNAEPALAWTLALPQAQDLSSNYVSCVPYALERHQRPLFLLENHNLINPAWWHEDPAFSQIQSICTKINEIVRQKGIDPAARLVVLRRNASDYDWYELKAMRDLLQEASSDIWWLPLAKADKYANEDLTVLGEEIVLKLDHPAAHAWEALATIRKLEDKRLAQQTRTDLEVEMRVATPVKIGGKMVVGMEQAVESPQGMKSAIARVIAAGA